MIYRVIILKCSSDKAFELVTLGDHLHKWLTAVAEVEPRVGGKYELFWNPEDRENDSTIGCKILAIQSNRFLTLEWKGPTHFKRFMNQVRPLTNVSVSFIPCPEGTEVHLLHSGWRDTSEWEEARQWFDKAWAMALSELQKYVSGDESAKCCQ